MKFKKKKTGVPGRYSIWRRRQSVGFWLQIGYIAKWGNDWFIQDMKLNFKFARYETLSDAFEYMKEDYEQTQPLLYDDN